jgi:hypothetical protein
MSALGHKQIYAVQNGMSALPLKADICGAPVHVRFGPIVDIRCRLSMCQLPDRRCPSSRVIVHHRLLQGVSGVGAIETARSGLQLASPCASLNPFRTLRTSCIQRAPSAARRCGSLE